MNKIYKITLYPLKDIEGLTLSMASREYFKERKITLNYDMVDTSSSITVIACKNKDNKTYTEISTGKIINTSPANQNGYLCIEVTTNFNSAEEVAFYGQVTNFFLDCERRQRKLYSNIESYINEVYDHQKDIDSYSKKIFEASPYHVFNFVNIYNNNTRSFDKFLLPLRDEELAFAAKNPDDYHFYMARNIMPFTHKYTDLMSRHRINNKQSGNDAIYSDSDIDGLTLSDFTFLSSIFDMIKYPNELKTKIDSAFTKENSKIKARKIH